MSIAKLILHPTDFSENCRYAFRTACSLASESEARLIVLHVMPASSSPILSEPSPDPLKPVESQPALANRFVWPDPADPRLAVEHRVAEGDSADEIVRLAKDLSIDLIVMGSHGRTGLRRLLTGSVAEEVLRKANCPVLVVRNALPDAATKQTSAPAKPGEVVGVQPSKRGIASVETQELLRGSELEVVRLALAASSEYEERSAKGEIVVQCLEGRVVLDALGSTRTFGAGNVVQLPAGTRFEIGALENATLLLTASVPRKT